MLHTYGNDKVSERLAVSNLTRHLAKSSDSFRIVQYIDSSFATSKVTHVSGSKLYPIQEAPQGTRQASYTCPKYKELSS